MADLSPAAAAVWNAYNDVMERVGVFEDCGDAIAAALHAVADQWKPEDMPEMHSCCHELIESIHSELLTIAAELEGSNDPA
jgi:hypothetical protein